MYKAECPKCIRYYTRHITELNILQTIRAYHNNNHYDPHDKGVEQ